MCEKNQKLKKNIQDFAQKFFKFESNIRSRVLQKGTGLDIHPNVSRRFCKKLWFKDSSNY